MMKIQMLKNQPKPGYFPPLPCYLAGQAYELATTEEIAMGKGFIQDGVAVAVGGIVTVTNLDGSPLEREADGTIKGAPLVGLTDEQRAALPRLLPHDADAPSVTVVVQGAGPSDAEVVKAVDKALRRAKPKK